MIYLIKLTQEDIDQAESLLGFRIPEPLRRFYLSYGYGNLPSEYNTNLLMHPVTAANFRFKREEWSGFPDIDAYDEVGKTKFIFFEVNETTFFSVDLDGHSENVYCDDVVIAKTIKEFLIQMAKNPAFYKEFL